MTKNHDSNITTKMKVWTVLCIVLVCAVALFARGVLIQKLFPLEHKEIIAKYSAEYDIDEFLVCAVIYAESGFSAEAVSSKNATGLMQIVPDTGAWAAQKIGIEPYNEQMLTDPDTNIRIGCWYLNYLNQKYDGDTNKVLAAYNAGPSRVDEWTDADGVLRVIPFEETENYVKRINRNYNVYKGIYNDF